MSMNSYKEYYFSLNVSPLECQQLYTGQSPTVTIEANNGQLVRLPIANMRRFVSPIGIRGSFRLVVNEQNKIIAFEQIA